MKTITLKIDQMHCPSCAMNIDGELEDTAGVVKAETSYAKALTRLTYDPAVIGPEAITQVIEKVGYQAKVLN